MKTAKWTKGQSWLVPQQNSFCEQNSKTFFLLTRDSRFSPIHCFNSSGLFNSLPETNILDRALLNLNSPLEKWRNFQNLWKENFLESENKSPYESHHMQFCFWCRASAFQDTQFFRINHDLLFMDLTNFKANWLSFQLLIVRDSEFWTFCDSDSSVISVIRGFSHFHSFRFNVNLLLYIFFEFENSVPVIQPPRRSATLLYRGLQYRTLSYAAPGQFCVCWPRWWPWLLRSERKKKWILCCNCCILFWYKTFLFV